VLQRGRVSAWFERNQDVPIRLLVAPAGCGKTSAIVMYLATSARPAAYVALRDDETPETLRERLAEALDVGYVPASFQALLAALATRTPREVAVDDVDRATPETMEELLEMAAEAPQGIGFIYATRSRAMLDVGQYLARGLAVILDENQLALDADDVTRLCESIGVPCSPADVARFLEETEGWPIVCAWAVRDASESRIGLAKAYEHWRRSQGRHFIDFIDDEFKRAGNIYRTLFRAAANGEGSSDERDRLATLEARGLFVRHEAGTFKPYRVARQFDIETIPAASAVAPETTALLVVRMFGRFEATIGGRRIEWIRRREAQIFKYLLLKPDGSATRNELREVFWPDANQHLATQSIRTASSNIRKAIAAIVGYGNVDRYFQSGGTIAVVLENAVIDARRFTAHIADGDAELENRRVPEALAHYRAAEALYGGELLSGEYPEPWYAPRAAMYTSLFLGLLERLADLYAEHGSARRAKEYADRAAELRPTLSLVNGPELGGAGA
jgi:DNA-binding SARP family transcriptional activator